MAPVQGNGGVGRRGSDMVGDPTAGSNRGYA
jgi:hypothetical protein